MDSTLIGVVVVVMLGLVLIATLVFIIILVMYVRCRSTRYALQTLINVHLYTHRCRYRRSGKYSTKTPVRYIYVEPTATIDTAASSSEPKETNDGGIAIELEERDEKEDQDEPQYMNTTFMGKHAIMPTQAHESR